MTIRYITILLLCILAASCADKTETEEPLTELPYSPMKLQNLEDVSAGEHDAWRIAGNVFMDWLTEDKYSITDGKNVLVNEFGKKGSLVTTLEHGDLDIKMDFMLSKGARAALLFQGTHPLQLADSWNVDGVNSEGLGIIPATADSVALPSINACRAPGLWQHLYVSYQAPRFDTSGKKISNAVFKEVRLNGKRIQQNVEVTGDDKAERSAFVIDARRGAVAFQNIQYKAYGAERIAIRDMQFRVYTGLYREYDTLEQMTPLRTGRADSLHWAVGDKRAQIVFEGTMSVPVEGDYIFRIRAGGPAFLLIDDKEVVNNNGTRDYTRYFHGRQSLKSGDHNVKIIYANYDESLVVEYEGQGIPFTALTSPSSERKVRRPEPFEYVVQDGPGIQRGFFTHHDKVNPYTMSVGLANGLNYAYDLNTYNILSVWRGKFIDVSNMWVERGESQMEIPLGAPLELAGIPATFQLTNVEGAWPDTVQVDNNIYTERGYRLDENGLPVFLYSYNDMKVEDHIYPTNTNVGFTRKVTLTFLQPPKDTYFLLGCGEKIEILSNGSYAIDDKEYYIENIQGIDQSSLSIVKGKDGREKLLLSLSKKENQTQTFSYSIIW